MGVLLTLQEPTQAMDTEAGKGGVLRVALGTPARLQITTAEEVLGEHRIAGVEDRSPAEILVPALLAKTIPFE